MTQTALITGAAGGIGRAIARRLAGDGFNVAVSDLSDQRESLEHLAAELRELDVAAYAAPADVTDDAAVADMVAATVRELGSLGVAVANAGVCEATALLDMSVEQWDHTMRVNSRGTFVTYQAAARQMITQGTGGRIIGAASVASYAASALVGHYAASKFAVKALTEAAAQEWASHGITVNAYAPGLVHTAMWDRLDAQLGGRDGLPAGAVISGAVKDIPLGRVQSPADVAGLVSFLASPDAGYMTGQSVIMDGGMLLG